MTDANRTRPTTFEEALRALDDAEGKLRAREDDDTGIRRLTESVRQTEERFRMLAAGVPNHLLFLDPDLRIVFANDVFLEAAGWSAKKAVGLHISEIMGVERFMERQPYYERALAGETVSYDSMGAAGNESGYFNFSYRPSFDAAGKVRGIFSMATDISERRKIQLELEANRAPALEQGSRAVRLCRVP
jgi:PAS domain S-box-containing protein